MKALLLISLVFSFGKLTLQGGESECREHETWSTCVSPCGDGCNNVALGLACIQSCVLAPACVCKPGFARSPISAKCIPSDRCPKKWQWNYRNSWLTDNSCRGCGPNEEVKVSNACAESCNAAALSCLRLSNHSAPACYCRDHYCRNSNGFCVPKPDWSPPNFPETCNNPNCTQLQPIYVPYDPTKGYPVVVLYPIGKPPCKNCIPSTSGNVTTDRLIG